MTISGDSKEKKSNHPKLPALRSVPAPQRLTGKASTSLTTRIEQKIEGKANASPQLSMPNPESSKEDKLTVPKLPALCSAPEQSTRETSRSNDEKIGQKTERVRNDLPELKVASPERSEEKKTSCLKLPRVPSLGSVPAPPKRTKKARPVLTKKVQQKIARRGNALSKPEVKNSQGPQTKKSNLLKRPTLRSVPALWRIKQKESSFLNKDDGQKTATKGDSRPMPTSNTNNSEDSKSASLSLPKLPVLRSVPAPKRILGEADGSLSRNVKQNITREGNNSSKSGLSNQEGSKDENINLPRLPPLRSIPAPKRHTGRKRAFLNKGVGQQTAGSINSPPQPDKAKPRGSKDRKRNDSKLSIRRSVPLAQRLKAKNSASLTRKVAQKLFGGGATVPKADTNLGGSADEKPSYPKRPSLRSVPVSQQLPRKASGLVNNRPEKKIGRKGSTLPKQLQRSIPTSPGPHQLQPEMNNEKNGAYLPKMNSVDISKFPHSRGHHASKLHTEKATKPHELMSAGKGTGNRRAARGKQTSPQAEKTTDKPKPKPKVEKTGAIRKTRKSGPTSCNVSKAEYQVRKGSSFKEPASTRIASSSSQRGYLSSSDSSHSDASRESEGSYTSASSEEIEGREMVFPVSDAGKGGLNADGRLSQITESSHENTTAPKGIKKNVKRQVVQSAPSPPRHLVRRKGIKSRASESMLSRPAKLTGLKRSFVANIGKTCNGISKEEEEAPPTKRQRSIAKVVSRNNFQSISYAEQLKAVGQDISGGGCPVRQDSETEEEE